MNSPLARRIAGTAALVGMIALLTLGFELRFARPEGTTEFQMLTTEAGIGMQPGTDLKVRGVPVGSVIDVQLQDNGQPLITARLDAGIRVPTTDLEVAVSPKTFFGEKQIDMTFPLGNGEQGPFLQEGDVLEVTDSLTEVEDVLGTLQPLLAGIDSDDLSTLFDAIAELEGEGDRIAENLDVTAQLAEFGASVADDTLVNARLLTSLATQLEAGAADFDRLNQALPPAVAILSERQAEIETTLEALSSFSLAVASWLDVERDRFDELLASGDIVGAFLERNVQSIPSIVEGIRLFAEAQSEVPDPLDDGTFYVPFRVFIDPGDLEEMFGPLGTAGGN